MICRKATRIISEGMDRQLSPIQRFSLGYHLLVCTSCRRFKKQLLLLRYALRRFSDWFDDSFVPEDSQIPPEARERIADSLRNKE